MLFLIIILVLLLPVMCHLIFPMRKPVLDHYFSPGQTYTSKGEGITQIVLKQEGNKIYGELQIEPGAKGPPEHMHKTFDESISVIQGTLTVTIDGQTTKANPGDRVVFKKGSYHSMRNEGDTLVMLRSTQEEDYVPVEFAYALSQLYPLMNKSNGFTFSLFAKICVLDELFDSIPAGPPPAVFSLIKKIVKPYARLIGVRP